MARSRSPFALLGMLLVVCAEPVAAAAARVDPSAVALAKRSIAVLRTAPRPADRVPGLKPGPGIVTRRIATIQGRRLWLGVVGRNLCLWLHTSHSGSAITCKSVALAVRPASPLALLYAGTSSRVTAVVIVTDGSSMARAHIRAQTVRLKIHRNAIVRVASSGERLVWAAPDRTEHQLVVQRPGAFAG